MATKPKNQSPLWTALATVAVVFTGAIILLLGGTQRASAQEAGQMTGTCNGAQVTGTPEQVASSLALLGCGSGTAAAPATGGTVVSGANTCKVNTGANLRAQADANSTRVGGATAGTVLQIISVHSNWLQTTSGWIYSPLCTMVPPSEWTPPADNCSATAKILPNDDKVDTIIGERGETIQVTILSSGDLCDPYRVIWDGVRIRQDRLPKEGERRSFEADFQGWWAGAATWAGVSCLLETDHDKNSATPRLAVFDRAGRTVGSTHGTQVFDLMDSGWYMAVCQGTLNPGFTVIRPTDGWTR